MATKEELEAQLAKAKDDIATLARMTGSTASDGVANMRSEIDNHIAQLSEETRALLSEARNQGTRARHAAETQVRENPLASIGIAVAAGFVLAKLMQR